METRRGFQVIPQKVDGKTGREMRQRKGREGEEREGKEREGKGRGGEGRDGKGEDGRAFRFFHLDRVVNKGFHFNLHQTLYDPIGWDRDLLLDYPVCAHLSNHIPRNQHLIHVLHRDGHLVFDHHIAGHLHVLPDYPINWYLDDPIHLRIVDGLSLKHAGASSTRDSTCPVGGPNERLSAVLPILEKL